MSCSELWETGRGMETELPGVEVPEATLRRRGAEPLSEGERDREVLGLNCVIAQAWMACTTSATMRCTEKVEMWWRSRFSRRGTRS